MKEILLICLITSGAFYAARSQNASNQTPTDKPAKSTVPEKKAETPPRAIYVDRKNLRLVEGKLYNIELSTNWITLPTKPDNPPDTPSHLRMLVHLKVDSINGDDLICEEVTTASRNSAGESEYYVVKNYPNVQKLVTGDSLPFMRVMRVGSRRVHGRTVAVYDYGTPPGATTPAKTNSTSSATQKSP